MAVAEPGGALRVARGARSGAGRPRRSAPVADPRLEQAREDRQALRVVDAEAEGALDLPGAPPLRSWVALPLLLEGDVVGMLLAGRAALDTFTEDELLRAKAVAFWAAAALRRVQLQDQVRRYATLLEQVVEVDQRVFRGDGPDALSPAILEGACRIGELPRGDAGAADPARPRRGRDVGRGLRRRRRAAPRPRTSPRWPCDACRRRGCSTWPSRWACRLPAQQVFLVPLATADGWLGCLVLLDPNGESPEDRLLEAYASRSAAAWRHAAAHHGRP